MNLQFPQNVNLHFTPNPHHQSPDLFQKNDFWGEQVPASYWESLFLHFFCNVALLNKLCLRSSHNCFGIPNTLTPPSHSCLLTGQWETVHFPNAPHFGKFSTGCITCAVGLVSTMVSRPEPPNSLSPILVLQDCMEVRTFIVFFLCCRHFVPHHRCRWRTHMKTLLCEFI
jgi:hypothetical protein